jgi:hypothetical protein
MAGHTPVPWQFAPTGKVMTDSYSQPFGVAEAGTGNLVAGVFGDVKGGKEVAEANARLIAAAPDLLGTLQTIVDGLGEFLKPAELDKAIAVLKKARG